MQILTVTQMLALTISSIVGHTVIKYFQFSLKIASLCVRIYVNQLMFVNILTYQVNSNALTSRARFPEQQISGETKVGMQPMVLSIGT